MEANGETGDHLMLGRAYVILVVSDWLITSSRCLPFDWIYQIAEKVINVNKMPGRIWCCYTLLSRAISPTPCPGSGALP